MWNIKISIDGDEPSEAEVEAMETAITEALDAAGIDYLDVGAS